MTSYRSNPYDNLESAGAPYGDESTNTTGEAVTKPDPSTLSYRGDKRRVRRVPRPAAIALLCVVALVAAACSSSAAGTASGSTSTSVPSTTPTSPGATGTVAAVSGTSMEVQNPQSGQVTVSWTGTTAFTQTLAVGASAVAVGDCVTATGTPGSGSSSSSPLSATGVIISQPGSTGSCTAGGAFGTTGQGNGGFRPNGGSRPGGGTFPANGAGAANLAVASGKVTQASASGFTIQGTLRKLGRPSTSASSTTTTVPTPNSIDVTTSSTTTYSQASSTDSSSLAVGRCVTARGSANQTGAISATSISIRSPGANGCTSGFGQFGAGRSTAAGSVNG